MKFFKAKFLIGYTDTELLNEAFREYAKKQSIFNRIATSEEIAEVVGFLAGEKSRWVTGQNLIAAGGGTMTQ